MAINRHSQLGHIDTVVTFVSSFCNLVLLQKWLSVVPGVHLVAVILNCLAKKVLVLQTPPNLSFFIL